MSFLDTENNTSNNGSLKRNHDDCFGAYHEVLNSSLDLDDGFDFDFDREVVQPKAKRRASMPSMHVGYSEDILEGCLAGSEEHRPFKRRNSMNDSERHRNITIFDMDNSLSSRASSVATFQPVELTNYNRNDDDDEDSCTSSEEGFEDSLMDFEQPPKMMGNEDSSCEQIAQQVDIVEAPKETLSPSAATKEEGDSEHEDCNDRKKTSKKISPEDLNKELEDRLEKLQSLMMRSSVTQRALQRWDKKLGLPKNHSVTMVKSEDSRQKIQEEVVLAKVIAEASRLSGTLSSSLSRRVSSFLS